MAYYECHSYAVKAIPLDIKLISTFKIISTESLSNRSRLILLNKYGDYKEYEAYGKVCNYCLSIDLTNSENIGREIGFAMVVDGGYTLIYIYINPEKTTVSAKVYHPNHNNYNTLKELILF